ncbi:MAG: helix-turn-helix domain-containing protein [Chitinophagaceae bacterium]
MSLQLNIFLLLFGGLQGLLLSLFFIRKKLFHSGYIFLLLYFAVMLLQITVKVMSKVWLMTNWNFFYNVSYLLPLLYGPLIWLFVRQFLLKKRFRLQDSLHFLPFVFLSANLWFIGQASPIWRLYYPDMKAWMEVVSIISYHALALYCWHMHRKSLKNYYSETHKLQLQWVRQFIIASLITCSMVALALYFLYKTYPGTSDFRFAFLILTVLIYWVSYAVLTKPAVFSLIRGRAEINDETFTPVLTIHRPGKKYSNSGLSADDIKRIQVAIEKISREQKPFLNPELTIQDLAVMVHCNRHQLSQVLNESIGKSFYDYINGCRVEEAKALLLDPARCSHKIASIAYDAGFNSLSTFNDVFRKSTGLTPSQFRKKNAEQSLEKRGAKR